MKKIFGFLFSILFIFTFFAQITVSAQSAPDFEISSNIAAIANLDMDTVVFEKNSEQITDPSTFTKVVTAIVAMENCSNIDERTATASAQAINPLKKVISTNVSIQIGEILTIRQLLNCMLNYSANDAANVIAEEIGGSIEGFVKMMNEFVVKIGCTDTEFVNPHGIYEVGQYTTAKDMLLIGKYAMEVPGLLEITNLTTSDSLTIPATNMSSERKISQTNHMLLKNTPYYYQYASGIKAGGSGSDERLIMVSATKDGYKYLCVMMESPYAKEDESSTTKTNYAMKEAKQLFQWVFSNYKYKTIVNKTTAVGELPVKYSWDTDHVQLLPESDLSSLVLASLDSTGVLIEPDADTLPSVIEAPANKGDVIGTASVMVAGEKIETINIVIAENIKRSNTLYILDQLKNIFTSTVFRVIIFILVLLIIGYLFLSIVYNRKRKKLRLAKSNTNHMPKRLKSHKYDTMNMKTRHDDPRIRSRYEDRENINVRTKNSTRNRGPRTKK